MSSNSPSPFLNLPVELRLQIYHAVFVSLTTASLGFVGESKDHEPTNLLQTCRQIRTEANAELAEVLQSLHLEFQDVKSARVAELAVVEGKIQKSNGWVLLNSKEYRKLLAAQKSLASAKKASNMVEVLITRSERRVSDGESSASATLVEEV